MLLSSHEMQGWRGLEGLAVAEHGVKDVDLAASQGDQGLVVPFALGSGCHGGAPLARRRAARLLPPVLALPSDAPQSLISSPEQVVGQGDQPPEPSSAASMKPIPAPPALSQSREPVGRAQEGRAA